MKELWWSILVIYLAIDIWRQNFKNAEFKSRIEKLEYEVKKLKGN